MRTVSRGRRIQRLVQIMQREEGSAVARIAEEKQVKCTDTQNSPAPWRVEDKGVKAFVRAEDATIVVLRHRLPGVVNEANMRLIAAAPDLLAAAMELMQQYDSSGDFTMGGNLTNQPFLKFRAAIAKANR